MSLPGADFTKTLHHDVYPSIEPANFSARDKVVLIAGASNTCGKAMAEAFCQAEAKGVILAARSEGLLREITSDLRPRYPDVELSIVPMDVSDPASVEAGLRHAVDMFNELDILINNAACAEPWDLVHEQDPEDWMAAVDFNLKGSFLVTHFALPYLLNPPSHVHWRKYIINVSSLGSHLIGGSGGPGITSKFTSAILTDYLGAAYSEHGIMSIALYPGAVRTDTSLKMPEYLHPLLVDTPELSAATIVWLTCSEESDFLNGRYYIANWDKDQVVARKADILDRDLLKLRLVVD